MWMTHGRSVAIRDGFRDLMKKGLKQPSYGVIRVYTSFDGFRDLMKKGLKLRYPGFLAGFASPMDSET